MSSILFISLFIPILAEVANSAIERVVDLVTLDYHIMAKRAKDVGATLVLLSIFVTLLIWSSVLVILFIK
jgi:diacylglycerol kinase (ATP)